MLKCHLSPGLFCYQRLTLLHGEVFNIRVQTRIIFLHVNVCVLKEKKKASYSSFLQQIVTSMVKRKMTHNVLTYVIALRHFTYGVFKRRERRSVVWILLPALQHNLVTKEIWLLHIKSVRIEGIICVVSGLKYTSIGTSTGVFLVQNRSYDFLQDVIIVGSLGR